MTLTDYSLVIQDKELREWLVSGAWKERYDTATVNRSKPHINPRLISGIKIVKPAKTDLTMIQAVIAGTSDIPYKLLMAVSRREAVGLAYGLLLSGRPVVQAFRGDTSLDDAGAFRRGGGGGFRADGGHEVAEGGKGGGV